MRILGLIPVRGGSKGIPHKNKKLLHGKPLMQYTIEAAQQATQLDTVLAEDNSGTLGVVQHALRELEKMGRFYDAVCLLQVTNPFRTSVFVDEAIAKFKKEDTDALISVLKVPHEYNPHWVFKPNDKGYLNIATGEKEIIKRRQELPNAFIRDGSIYITKSKVILEQNSLYGNTLSYIISNSEHHVNIDTSEGY